MRQSMLRAALTATAAIGLAFAGATSADADLRNRYSFTTDATDSIGGQNGTLVGTNGSFTGGQLVLANTGQGSNNPPPEGAFLDLPNGLISGAANVNGVVTIEMWVTMQANRNWAAAFSAGISNGGEGIADGAGGQPYIQVIPRTGDVGNDFRVTSSYPENAGSQVDDLGAADGTDLAIGRREHVVAVYDQSAGTPGTITVYRNGALMGTSGIAASLDLKTFAQTGNPTPVTPNDVNIWLGRSQYPDPLVAASYDEFRIYDSVVTAEQALTNAVFGPDVTGVTGIPYIEVDKDSGEVFLKNPTSQPLAIDYYSIASTAGALLTGTWDSLDNQNYNAVDGPDGGSVDGDTVGEGWDEAGGSNANFLNELFLGSAGSTLAAGATLSLGEAYNTSTFGEADGDLVFQFSVVNGARFTAPVTYIGEGGGQLVGDYNLDGSVDAADYTVFRDTLGLSVTPGTGADGSNNGIVDAADYTAWKNAFGSPASGALGGTSAVPEPTSLGLIAVGLLGLRLRRRCR